MHATRTHFFTNIVSFDHQIRLICIKDGVLHGVLHYELYLKKRNLKSHKMCFHKRLIQQSILRPSEAFMKVQMKMKIYP